MEITLGDYIFINLESKDSLVDAKNFIKGRNYKEAFCNYGDVISHTKDLYILNNYVKVEKSIKLRELTLENRMDFLNFINKSNQYNKYEMEDVLKLINTKSGLFLYEKEYIGSYIVNDDVIENIYSRIKVEDYLQKLVNKFGECKILCDSNNDQLIKILNKLGFTRVKSLYTYYKI